MDKHKLAHIERKLANATPGPWIAEPSGDSRADLWVSTRHGEPRLGYKTWDGMFVASGCEDDPVAGRAVATANAVFVTSAPDDIRQLLDEVYRLRKIIHGRRKRVATSKAGASGDSSTPAAGKAKPRKQSGVRKR